MRSSVLSPWAKNAASARLLLNGQPVDSEAKRDKDTDILYWDIAYQPGILRCEASNNASYEIKTTQAPHALRLTTDSCMHVFVEIVDQDGKLVKSADNEVTLTVNGGRLLGMENGNIMDSSITGRSQPNRLRAFGGCLVAYILPQQDKDVTIKATAPFLQDAEIKFK